VVEIDILIRAGQLNMVNPIKTYSKLFKRFEITILRFSKIITSTCENRENVSMAANFDS